MLCKSDSARLAPASVGTPARPLQKLFWPADRKEMVLVPAGDFIMGADGADWEDQKPAHRVYVAGFYIDRYLVTNAEYKQFLDQTGYPAPAHLARGQIPLGREADPVNNLSWQDARAFANWAGKRLPTEAEWEKAASWDPTGQTKTRYPWGNAWDESRCNTLVDDGPGEVTRVDAHSPAGDSPCGAADMIGNVWEWCSSAMAPYPYRADDGREDSSRDVWRVLRGAGWDTVLERNADCTFRYAFPAHFYLPSFGCRCVVSADRIGP